MTQSALLPVGCRSIWTPHGEGRRGPRHGQALPGPASRQARRQRSERRATCARRISSVRLACLPRTFTGRRIRTTRRQRIRPVWPSPVTSQRMPRPGVSTTDSGPSHRCRPGHRCCPHSGQHTGCPRAGHTYACSPARRVGFASGSARSRRPRKDRVSTLPVVPDNGTPRQRAAHHENSTLLAPISGTNGSMFGREVGGHFRRRRCGRASSWSRFRLSERGCRPCDTAIPPRLLPTSRCGPVRTHLRGNRPGAVVRSARHVQ